MKKKRGGFQIEELDNDVMIRIFSFFTKNELNNNRLVSKSFKNISDTALNDLVKRTRGQIFYLVGEPILITSPRSTTNKIANTIFGVGYDVLYINFRNNISQAEIRSSFPPKKEIIRLFKLEEHALAYARSLRTIENPDSTKWEKVYQPAIFKVQYLKTLSYIKNIQEVLLIDKHNESDYFDGQINIDVEYFHANIADIIPHLGIVKIEHDQKGKFKEYPKVAYSHQLNSENYATRIFSTLNSYMKLGN